MRRLLATLLLGSMGSALLVVAFSRSTWFPLNMVPFVLLAVATPLVLRGLRLGAGYRQMFASCAGVGAMMVATTCVWAAVNAPSSARTPVPSQWWRVALLAAFVLFGSALAARAAWHRSADSRSTLDDVATALLVGVSAYAVVALALLPALFPRWSALASRPAAVLETAGMSGVEAFMFTVGAAVTIVPVVLALRHSLRRRFAMGLVGAALAPLLLFAEVYLSAGNRGIEVMWGHLVTSPIPLIVRWLPSVVAGAAVGWWLALPHPGKPAVAMPCA